MGPLLQDLRYALRSFSSRPGFAAVAVLTLAIGIGLNASVFTVVDAALMRALPYAEPDRLVHLWQVEENQERTRFAFAWQTLRELQAEPGAFTSVAGYAATPVAWTGRPEAEELPALRVTSNFFDVLGVHPALGRGFLPGEDELGGPRAVVLRFWPARSPEVPCRRRRMPAVRCLQSRRAFQPRLMPQSPGPRTRIEPA